MVRAYVLIVVEPNAEHRVVEDLKKIKDVVRADVVFGEYDVIAIVETKDVASLSKIITKIRSRTKGVLKTSTMITQETYEEMIR